MLAGILALVTVIAKLFPETVIGRLLHRYVVELPLEMAERMERRHLILVVVLLCCSQALALLGSADLAMIYAVDMSIYLDAVLAAYLTASVTRIGVVRSQFKAVIARLMAFRPRPRSRRTKTLIRRPKKPSNDDGHGWAPMALAA